MPDLNERDAKLVQWLSEAYTKESELEADLTAHIKLTTKDPYKKRLQQHLKETKDHKKQVAARIKKLGGSPSSSGLPGVPKVVGEVAGKAVSGVKGQVGAARAAVTEQAATHLRNAQEERKEEQLEIAIYTRIGTLAELVGDRETQKLATDIRKQEERMARFLDAEIVRLVKDVVKSEIPKDQRAAGSSRRRTTTRSRTTGSGGSGRSASRAGSPNGSAPARAARRTTKAKS